MARFTGKESVLIYGFVLACSLLFFVLGVFFGRSYQQSPEPATAALRDATREPVEDVQSQLGFYNEMLSADQEKAGSEASNEADTADSTQIHAEDKADSFEEPPQEVVPAAVTDTPAPATPSNSDSAGRFYTVQVGAHKTAEEANQVVLRLTARGYDARVVGPVPGIPFYRVCVGETPVRSDTSALVERLKADGFNTYVRQVVPEGSTN